MKKSFSRQNFNTSELLIKIQGILIKILSHAPTTIAILSIVSGLSWFYLREQLVWLSYLCLILPLATYAFLLSPVGISIVEKGLTIWIPADKGQSADAIVVLGRGPMRRSSRVEHACKLWQAERAPLIFVSGRKDAPIISQSLKNCGVPVDKIMSENRSRTTEENAQFTVSDLYPKSVRSIILVTDSGHMLRAWLTFKSLGIEVFPSSSGGYEGTSPAALVVYTRDYVGLIAYAMRGRYWPRPI